MSGNLAFSLAEWPSASACSFAMYGNPAFSMLLLHVVFVVTGNPTFSLGEWPSSPNGSYIREMKTIAYLLWNLFQLWNLARSMTA